MAPQGIRRPRSILRVCASLSQEAETGQNAPMPLFSPSGCQPEPSTERALSDFGYLPEPITLAPSENLAVIQSVADKRVRGEVGFVLLSGRERARADGRRTPPAVLGEDGPPSYAS